MKDRMCVALRSPKGVCRFHVIDIDDVATALASGFTFPSGIVMSMDRRGTVFIDDIKGELW